MTILTLADALVVYLTNAIRSFPDGFYDSMGYTCTRRNLTHPITWGLLAQFVRQELKDVVHIGIDVRMNTGTGQKFQPDVVAYGGDIANLSPLLFIDYESPNSSDGRPICKDVIPYLAWSNKLQSSVPYIVITTLPNKSVTTWSNWDGVDDYELLKKNPYTYWYPWYRKELVNKRDATKNIALINIDGKVAKKEFPA